MVKAEAFFHLTANFNYLLMVLLSLLMFPSMFVRYNMGWTEMLLIDVPLFFAATFSVVNFYMVCQRELYPGLEVAPEVPAVRHGDRHRPVHQQRPRRARGALAQGAAASSRARRSTASSATRDDWQGKKYHQIELAQPLIECALGLYFTVTVFYALANGIYGTLPFLVLFQVGFLYTGLLSIVQQFGGDDLAPQIAGGKWRPAQLRGVAPRRRLVKPKAGLEDVVATSSAICFIDGDRGVSVLLRLRHPRPGASSATFEEVCFLLWHRRLPTRAELGDLQTQLAAARPLPEPIIRLMRQLPPTDGMDAAADADVRARALRRRTPTDNSPRRDVPQGGAADRRSSPALVATLGPRRGGRRARSRPIRRWRTPPTSSTC